MAYNYDVDSREVVKAFSLNLRSNSVESGPPLSTILGNYQINTTKFCKEFNEFTADLPKYFLLEVKINIFNDKTYSFVVMEPTTSFLVNLASFNRSILSKGSGGFKAKPIKAVSISDIFLICKFKYGIVNERNLKIILGTVFSMDLYVVE